MGTSKTQIFTDDQNKLAAIAKALGHPARIAIIQYIIQANACVCGDIVDKIGLAQSTISQHLKELKKVGLIKGNIDGTSICYCLNESAWEEYQFYFEKFFKFEFNENGCC